MTEPEGGFVESAALVLGGVVALLGVLVFWATLLAGAGDRGDAAMLGGPMALFGGMISAAALGYSVQVRRGALAARVVAAAGLVGAVSMLFFLKMA